MEQKEFFENAVDTLEILVSELGAGLAAWGVINLTEAYGAEAAKKETARDYCRRIEGLDTDLQRVSDDYAAEKIPFARYYALSAEYEAEQNELFEALYGLDAEIAAQKQYGLNRILQGAGFAAIAPPYAPSSPNRRYHPGRKGVRPLINNNFIFRTRARRLAKPKTAGAFFVSRQNRKNTTTIKNLRRTLWHFLKAQ